MVNLQQTRALLRQEIAEKGEGTAIVYLHGCGNMFKDKQDSDFRRDFTNRMPDGSLPPSAYVLTFRYLTDIPKSLEALENAFFSAKAKETKEAAKPKNITKIPILHVTDDDLLPEELEAKKLAETAAKGSEKNKGGRPPKNRTAPVAAGGDGPDDIGGPENGVKI